MISLAHITHGEALMNATLSRMLPGAFTSAFSSSWSVAPVPTWSRAQVDRFASSSAMRIYTSYRGMRSPGGAVARSGRMFRKCVLAGTPSLKTLTELPIRVVVLVQPAGASLREPGVEARGDKPVGALLALRRADREVVGVFVLGMARMPLDPPPGDFVRRRGLHELLPQLLVLQGTTFALPAALLPSLHPLAHPLHQVLRVGDVEHARALPLAADPFQRRDGAREGHLVVRRLRRGLVEIPPRHAVPRGCLDEGGVAAGARLGAVVPEAALVGVHEDADRLGARRHVRAGSRPGCRSGAGSPRRGTRRRRWAVPRGGSCAPRRTARRTGRA